MKSIGPIDVKMVERKSMLQNSSVVRARMWERMTKSASAVRNGLKMVERMRARSRQTRRFLMGTGVSTGW